MFNFYCRCLPIVVTIACIFNLNAQSYRSSQRHKAPVAYQDNRVPGGMIAEGPQAKTVVRFAPKANHVVETPISASSDKAAVVDKENPWPAIQARSKNAVIQVFTQIAQFNWFEPYKGPAHGEATGSGFFINEKGYLITNAHVVSQTVALSIQLPSMGKERLDVEVIGVSFDRDMALLKLKDEAREKLIKALGKITYLSLGDSNKVSRASRVMLMGYPLGQESLKSTVGVVSGIEHVNNRQHIQMDAPMNPGNSGGPAFNSDGEVIGINTGAIFEAQNVAYMIPINELKVALDQLFAREHEENKLVRKPLLGFFLHPASPELTDYLGNPQPGGAYVPTLYKESPAAKAGIKKGDMIYEMNGNRIDVYGEMLVPGGDEKVPFLDYLAYLPDGKPVHVVVYRSGKKLEFDVDFNQKFVPVIRHVFPDFESIDYEVFGGLVVMQLTMNHLQLMSAGDPDLCFYQLPKNQLEPALLITSIIPDSAAQRSRVLGSGAIIKEIDGVKVKTLEQFRNVIRENADKPFLKIRLRSGIVAALSTRQILCDEPRLSVINRYPLSELTKELLDHVKQKETRLTCPKLVPTPEPHAPIKLNIPG